MAREIIWSRNAADSFQETLNFWIDNNSNSIFARKLVNEVVNKLDLVKYYPGIGRQTNVVGIRVLIIARKYGLYYSWNSMEIRLLDWWIFKSDPTKNKYEKE